MLISNDKKNAKEKSEILVEENPLLDFMKIEIEKNTKLHQLRQAGQVNELNMRELEETIEVYFTMCVSKHVYPTPAGLANAIGIHHKKLLNVLKEDSERSEILNNAMEVIHSIYQELVVMDLMPVKTYTFMAKNYWGMSDKEIIEVKTADNDVRVVEIDSRLNTLRQLSN